MVTARRGGRPGRLLFGAVLALTLVLALALAPRDPAREPRLRDTAAAAEVARTGTLNGKHVVVISVDGLTPLALKRLGRERTPNLHRLIQRGAGTTNARTQVEMTVTLPNHTSMVTGRRISAALGGHGVTWNDDSVTTTVQEAAGGPVSSVFEVVDAAGGSTAVFSTKSKFSVWKRSWPASIDRSYIRVEQDAKVTAAMRADLAKRKRAFTFLHLGLVDQVGHADGWMSRSYLAAVRRADRLVGTVLRTINSRKALRRSTVVVLTADHGGVPGTLGHGDAARVENYRIPFAIWGAGVADRNLYALNTGRRASPGLAQPGAGEALQPVRNGDVANLSLALLGLGPVPGSLWNAKQDLRWR